MELVASKKVIFGVIFGKSAKVPFGLPKGHLVGGECFAPLEDGVLGNLAPPGGLEESASHHNNRHGAKTASNLDT